MKPNNEREHFPTAGRIAAVDYGTVRIGVAICDPDRILASPLDVRQVAGPESDADYFRKLVQREEVAAFIVGLPIHCDGGESEKSRECRAFACWLADQTERPVRLFDERFTTSAAQGRLQKASYSRKGKKRRIDAIAALVLLESFLEAARYETARYEASPFHQRLPGQDLSDPASGGNSLG